VVVDGVLDEPPDDPDGGVVDGEGRAPPPSDRPLRNPGVWVIVGDDDVDGA
jgi:hypothetical protein